MKCVAIISLIISLNCLGMGGVDYDYAPLAGSEARDKIDKLRAVSSQFVRAKRNANNFLALCEKIDLAVFDDAAVQSIKREMERSSVPFGEFLKIYKDNCRVAGDPEYSLFLHNKRAALLYCASYGLLKESQLLIARDVDVFEKDEPHTCFDKLFKRDSKVLSKMLLDSLIDVANNRLSSISGYRTDVHLPYDDIGSAIDSYNQVCKEARSLVHFLKYTQQLKKEVEEQVSFFASPLQLIIIRYAADYNHYEPVVDKDNCVIL